MALDSITREIAIDAPPAVVWSIVTEPRHLACWFSDEAEVDLRPGGAMLLTWHHDGAFRARVETVDPPRTFAFRWLRREDNDPVEGRSTTVVMTLDPDGSGGTILRVEETGFAELEWPAPERERYHAENAAGWIVELGELAAYVASVTTDADAG